MLCSKCGAENPAEARFCGKCGTPGGQTPPVVQVPHPPEPRPPEKKKARLPLPIVLISLILLAGLGGLVIVLVVFGYKNSSHQPEDDSYGTLNPADMPGPPMVPPTPAKGTGYENANNQPASTAQPPANFSAVSDTLYTQKIVGTWMGRKTWQTGAIIETRAIYSANGYATWTGTITYFGITTRFLVEVAWGVRNGVCYCRVESSNIPQFMPVGYTTQSKILNLTDERWTYVDALDGQTETSIRVAP